MKNVKNYACHRVYQGGKSYFNQSVVSVTPEGEVAACSSLSEEIPSTEWIGGIVILSNQANPTSLSDFRTGMNVPEIDRQLPVYAWHISDFDFQKESPTGRSIIRRL